MKNIKFKEPLKTKIKFIKTKEQISDKTNVFISKLSSDTQTISRNNKILKSTTTKGWIIKNESVKKQKKSIFYKIKNILKKNINLKIK